jgi:hypothetical protein
MRRRNEEKSVAEDSSAVAAALDYNKKPKRKHA